MSYRNIINEVDLPLMAEVKQRFSSKAIKDVDSVIINGLIASGAISTIRAGNRVAIAIGSRGIAGLPQVVRVLADHLLKVGAKPFIVPAMGSHGGATAEGQKEIISSYGISEAAMGIPVHSSMEVVEIGRYQEDLPVYFDREALKADVIIPINRIKAHTAFRGEIESGVIKMLVIGLGKHKGCSMLHSFGIEAFSDLMPAVGKYIIEKVPKIFGIALLENANKQLAGIKIIPGEDLHRTEPELLNFAKNLMPKILIKEIDLLIVDEIGKEISGEGMDPNVIRRYMSADYKDEAEPQRIVVLNLTDKTLGNAIGIGLADVTTRRVAEKFDPIATYTNTIATTILPLARMPMVMENDRDAIIAGLLGCVKVKPDQAKIVRIKNTSQLEKMWVSESLIDAVKDLPGTEVSSQLFSFPFDFDDNLKSLET